MWCFLASDSMRNSLQLPFYTNLCRENAMRQMLFRFHTLFILSSLILTNIARSEPASSHSQSTTQLTDNDRRILENGEIRGFRRVAGSILAVSPGFGIGHTVHGRYLHRGWIFTLGELGSAAVVATSLPGCETASDGCIVALLGFSGFIGFKVWEFVDSIVGPIRDNRQHRSLQSRSQMSMKPGMTILPMPVITSNHGSQKSTHIGIELNLTFH